MNHVLIIAIAQLVFGLLIPVAFVICLIRYRKYGTLFDGLVLFILFDTLYKYVFNDQFPSAHMGIMPSYIGLPLIIVISVLFIIGLEDKRRRTIIVTYSKGKSNESNGTADLG